jgi:ubiquinone biosynthesis protein
VIGIIDAGMVGRIDDVLQKQIEDILLAAGDRDAGRLLDAVTRVCGKPRNLDRSALRVELSEFFEEYATQSADQFNVSGALTGIAGILHKHRLVLPGRLSMLIKCLIILEGTGRLLSPDFNLAQLLQPWRKIIVSRRFSPMAQLKTIRRLYADWEGLAESVPKVARSVLDRMEDGRFAVRIEHQHLKSGVNRLVVGMFISSLLIGSAILIAWRFPPLIAGQSVFGVLGYALAVAFGFRMLWVNRDRFVSDKEGDWE